MTLLAAAAALNGLVTYALAYRVLGTGPRAFLLAAPTSLFFGLDFGVGGSLVGGVLLYIAWMAVLTALAAALYAVSVAFRRTRARRLASAPDTP